VREFTYLSWAVTLLELPPMVSCAGAGPAAELPVVRACGVSEVGCRAAVGNRHRGAFGGARRNGDGSTVGVSLAGAVKMRGADVALDTGDKRLIFLSAHDPT